VKFLDSSLQYFVNTVNRLVLPFVYRKFTATPSLTKSFVYWT